MRWILVSTAFTLLGNGPATQATESNLLASEWGGHLRYIGLRTTPHERSLYGLVDSGPFFDHQGELRLNHQLFAGPRLTFETHYELVGRKGDTLKTENRLREAWPTEAIERMLGGGMVDDKRRLMDLTRVLSQSDDGLLYHRLDRLNLTYTADFGTLRIGRQALTWGNGLLFNPMDLFNPFAPTAIQRDYKTGDDMLHVQLPLAKGELQLLGLPRREMASGEVAYDQSSVAAKWHATLGRIEYDLMLADHYDEPVLGIGASGYLGGAAWRGDLVYTHLAGRDHHSEGWQFVANIDYAWQWMNKNIYGLLEFYYNGLGATSDNAVAVSDPALAERIARGERFTLGRSYVAGQLQVELHPLLQAGVLTVVNIRDPSAVVQPQLMWDVATNLQLILGTQLNWGAYGTEFGGFDVEVGGLPVRLAPADSQYLWITYYF